MIQKTKNQNNKYNAFTLLEMIIVLIVMWILLMVTLFLSGDQIQKVRDKTVKETILAEMQSRYSRNLWSSSFAWTIYNHMDVTFSWWSNTITFEYFTWAEKPFITNQLIDNFEIRYMTTNYNFDWGSLSPINEGIKLVYNPYKMYCTIWEWNTNVVLVTRVNDSRDYCFEINKKNCRLIEMSEENCENLKTKANLN